MSTKNASLSTKQVMAGFGVSDMTIYTWRQGTKNYEKMPATVNGRFVSFTAPAVKTWAKKHALVFDEVKALAVPASVATGPKTKAMAKPAKKTTSKAPPPKRARGAAARPSA